MKKILLTLCSLMLLAGTLQAQPRAEDTRSVDAIIRALYEVISGEAGAPRDWERFKHLFAPDARLMPTFQKPDSSFGYRIWTPAEYAEMFSSRIATGFFEEELHRETQQYGTIIHAFSSYVTRQSQSGPVTNRGINSIQLLKDRDRYYILHILWCPESLGFPLPKGYGG